MSKSLPKATSGYVQVIETKSKKPQRDNNGLTVITIRYKDNFGRPKQFVTSDTLMKYDDSQYHDLMIKRRMRELGITKCRVQYDDFKYLDAGRYGFKEQIQRQLPKRMYRTVKL